MAVEVDYNKYLFMIAEPQPEELKYKASDFTALMEKLRNKNNAPPKAAKTQEIHHNTSVSKQPRLFRYNPTHDLESLWWIAIYFVANKETSEAPDAAKTHCSPPDDLIQVDLDEEVDVVGMRSMKSNVPLSPIHRLMTKMKRIPAHNSQRRSVDMPEACFMVVKLDSWRSTFLKITTSIITCGLYPLIYPACASL
jgi:hypothetical protein